MSKGDLLLGLWAERDSRYQRWRRAMEDSEAESIIVWRRREAEALEGSDRLRALTMLASWAPPHREMR